ncbi:hypothetical protein [Bacillus pumilus]|uniref:hypothetical protein n=1 Tax=Bacillus pumilus TaxID=1408 RepID=UPI003000A2CD
MKDIKEFHEWRQGQGLTKDDEHLISEITVCLSSLKYGAALPEEKKNAILERYISTFPQVGLPKSLQDAQNITFKEFASIVKNGTGKEVNVEELLLSLHKQGLCKELCEHLLETAN